MVTVGKYHVSVSSFVFSKWLGFVILFLVNILYASLAILQIHIFFYYLLNSAFNTFLINGYFGIYHLLLQTPSGILMGFEYSRWA